jgi:soluble lytic murein transglycosylase-like protein
MRTVLRRCLALSLAACALVAAPGDVHARIYTYTDAAGTIHFTNVEPPRGHRERWRLLDAGPGRAATVSGSSTEGCRTSRAAGGAAHDRSPDRYSRYDEVIVEASRLYAIPEALIRAVIKVESDYDPNVVSCAGAKGLMQVMPYEEKSEHIDHVFDPRQNILAGARMLRLKANHWLTHGDPNEQMEIDGKRWYRDIVLTIASYHAGVGAVTKYGGTVPPYKTTQAYVRMVLKQYERYRQRELARAALPSTPG